MLTRILERLGARGRTVSGVADRCRCVADHRPRPKEWNRHHIVPKSWRGTDAPDNLIVLCPTTHCNVHSLLNQYVRHQGNVPPGVLKMYSRYEQTLAGLGWALRPQDGSRIPYTSSHPPAA